MKKQLNFFPYYADLLRSGQKTTTIRLSNREQFAVGDEVKVTVGWSPDVSQELRSAKIEDVYKKQINDLTPNDFKGESPDCQNPNATALVLSAIYRTAVRLQDKVWVVRFEYTD